MATDAESAPIAPPEAGGHTPYVPENDKRPEFTLQAVLVGTVLGIIFGASSLYLVLKVGITVSASIPVAVLSITLFRALGKAIPALRATILENNIVQTTGSAGESIAFGVGVTMPALMLLGFDMSIGRVMVVSVLGGTLGILMMIPLRRAFIVKLHPKYPGEPGTLLYPEGTACAEVLKSGEEGGGSSGKLVFFGFGLAFAHKFATEGMNLLATTLRAPLPFINKAAVLASEMASELLGVGYIIGFRTSATMMAGAVLGYLVIIPVIYMFGQFTDTIIPPGNKVIRDLPAGNMKEIKELIDYLRDNYLLFIGAGCVATAGLISMFKTLPMIVRSVRSGISSLRGGASAEAAGPSRYDYDMSMRIVLFGSFGLLALLALFLLPEVGVVGAILAAILTLVFGFLFVTVSSRLTGEIGSTSNPISGMTVAALLMTCLIFLALGMTKPEERVLALCVGGVVCIAASNGGTTSQDLKTGYLLGATPRYQQFAILVGALTSAVVIGGTLMLFNSSQTIYSEKPEHLPKVPDAALKELTAPGAAPERKTVDGITLVRWNPDKSNPIRTATEPDAYWVEVTEEKPEAKKDDEKPGTPEPKPVKVGRVRYLIDPHLPERKTEEYKGQTYRVWYAIQPDFEGNPIRLLVTDQGKVAVRVDRAIMGKLTERVRDDGTVETIERKFDAPKTQVMGLIINGVLKRDLNWSMVLIGAMIAVMLELCGIPSLAFAVGVYVNIRFSVPIFLGGLIRLVIDKLSARKRPAAPTDEVAAIAETETSPAVLLSSGYIAGGSLGGVLIAFLEFAPKTQKALDFEKSVPQDPLYQWGAPILAFAVLMAILLLVGSGKLFRTGGQNANSGP